MFLILYKGMTDDLCNFDSNRFVIFLHGFHNGNFLFQSNFLKKIKSYISNSSFNPIVRNTLMSSWK